MSFSSFFSVVLKSATSAFLKAFKKVDGISAVRGKVQDMLYSIKSK